MTQHYSGGTVRIGSVRPILDVLQEMGYDPEQVLAAAGVERQVFANPDNLLSFQTRSHLMAVCCEATGRADFGLRVGQSGGLPAFGLIGYLAMHSPDVEQALQNLVRHLHLHVQGASAVIEHGVKLAFFGYEIYQPTLEGADQLEDAALARMVNIMKALCGSDWEPREVWFTHRSPLDIAPLKQFFQVPLRFDMDKAGLFFPVRWLGRRVRAADPELHRLLQKQIDELEENYRDDFPEQVRRVLHNALLTRHANAEDVAALFSIHSRTLHRRLKSHGTNFQEIADSCRYSIARHMLQTSDASMVQIAEMLDYADPRAFSRAFKRWSGTTPSRWRRALAS
jgi:AraC-like DNA-binding protein